MTVTASFVVSTLIVSLLLFVFVLGGLGSIYGSADFLQCGGVIGTFFTGGVLWMFTC